MHATRIYYDVELYVILATFIDGCLKMLITLVIFESFLKCIFFIDITPKIKSTTNIGDMSVYKFFSQDSVLQTSTLSKTAKNGLEGIQHFIILILVNVPVSNSFKIRYA